MAQLYVKKYRLLKELSQTELAIKTNLSQSEISNIENNVRSPTVDNLLIISKALNICFGLLIEHYQDYCLCDICFIKNNKLKDL